MNDLQPPPGMSHDLLAAIQGALKEEKSSPLSRWMKTLGASIASVAIVLVPLSVLFREQAQGAWLLAGLLWWGCLFVGFALYYHPQPRLAVPGFWSPWIFAKVLVLMTFLTCVEILVCPSFVFLHSPLPWNFFDPVAHWFMSWGGMEGCMFWCGLLFVSIGGSLTFAVISRTLKGSSSVDLLKASGLAYFTQIPVIALQLWEPGLRPFVLFWLAGSLFGTFAMALLVRVLAWKLQPGFRRVRKVTE